jgi:1-acyl-sn-glycerol-3-phosphate acyltransferase
MAQMGRNGRLSSNLKAAGQWALAGASAPLLLGPATALGPISRDASIGLLRSWADLQLASAGIDVHVEDRSGLHGRPGVLFVDLFQQTLLSALIYPRAFMQKFSLVVNVEFAALPWLGWATVAQGAVTIVRQRPDQAKAALQRVVQRLKGGESFGISIEGQRSRDGRLSPYKKGPVVLAIEAQCDIVPYLSHGEYALWPRGQWRVKPGRVDCVLYEPISTKGLTYDDRDRLVEQLRGLAERELALRGN